MADYIREHGNDTDDIAEDFLKRKGQSLIPDYLDFLQQPGHWGDELAMYLLAHMGNTAICVVTKQAIGVHLRGAEEADIVLVYLVCSIRLIKR